jgi:PEP-CTERM motif
MKKILGLFTLAVLLGTASAVRADSVPYPNVGQVAPTNTLVAISTGNVTGYFVQGGAASGGAASFMDVVGLLDLTTNTFSGWLFNNQTTKAGATANFGKVNAGDTLAVVILDVLPPIGMYSSDPSLSTDGLNHAYVTSWAGGILNGANIPAGLYIGTEDLPIFISDLNYNDDSFVLTGVSVATSVPEPVSLLLFGVGILGLAALSRRKQAVSR